MTIDYNLINEFRELSTFNSKTALEHYAKETHNVDLPRNITFDAMLAKLEDALKEPVVESKPEIVEPVKIEANEMIEPEVVKEEVKEVIEETKVEEIAPVSEIKKEEIVEETKPIVEEIKKETKINSAFVAPTAMTQNSSTQKSINLMADATTFANEVELDVSPQFHETKTALTLGSLRKDFVAALKQHIDENGATWLTAAADWDKTNVPLIDTDNDQLNNFIDYMKIVVTGAIAEDLDVIIRDSIDGRFIHITDKDYTTTGAFTATAPVIPPLPPVPGSYTGDILVETGIDGTDVFGMSATGELATVFGTMTPVTFTVDSIIHGFNRLYGRVADNIVTLKIGNNVWTTAQLTVGATNVAMTVVDGQFQATSPAVTAALQAADGTSLSVAISFT